MIAGIVIGSILLFFLLLLLCPVSVTASFDEEIRAKVNYLFLHFTIAPPKEKTEEEKAAKEKKKKKKKPEKPEEKKKSKIKEILEERGLSGFLRLMKELAKVAAGAGKKLFSHLVISHLSVHLRIGGSDAAQIATQYGQACAVVYPAFSVLVGNTKCKRHHIGLVPDFTSEQTKISFEVKAGIKPLFALITGISTLIRFLRVYRRKEKKEPVQQTAAEHVES